MQFNIKVFKDLEEQGYLRSSEKGPLVVYTYSDKCVYARYWTDITRVARGLILNKDTGEVVGCPFPKFFNLNEMPESDFKSLPMHLAYEGFEKLDGSLGVIFNYAGEWDIATRGSFYSEQAIKGQELLKKYNLSGVKENVTLLTEIIYPANKIVVNYGDLEKLVLLGAYDRDTGVELDPGHVQKIAESIGMEFAKSYDYTIEQMIELQKTLPKDQEGFVIRFSNGLRIKIKGDEYSKIHKMIMCMSPLSFWESMKNGVVDRVYLSQLPEEYRVEYEPIVQVLEWQYSNISFEIVEDLLMLPTLQTDPASKKVIGLFLKGESNGLKHPGAMFSSVLGRTQEIDKYIMKRIRPNSNELL